LSLPPSTTNAVAKTEPWRQVGQIFLAFGLTSLVGLERQLRGKNAGLRTHSIVGTTSALILLVSKYGFSDVIHEGIVVLDPSRIAAQIVSGISFLGAGLIITRQKTIRGLTTAASVWSAAAIGMAAGSGLWVLSLAVTGLHFVILLGFLPLEKKLPVFDKNSPFHVKNDEDDDDDNDNDNESL
jgi:putative Mg2+ transporter-C (MgtC) family protein